MKKLPFPLSFATMKALIPELQQLVGLTVSNFTKSDSREFLLSLTHTSVKRELSLLTSFQAPFLRFHLNSSKKPSTASSFTSSIIHSIQGGVIESIQLLNHDRILQIILKSRNSLFQLVGEFFPKRPNFYLLDEKNNIICSMNPSNEKIYSLPSNNSPGTITHPDFIQSKEIEEFYESVSAKIKFEEDKNSLISKAKKELIRLQRMQIKSEDALILALRWPQIQKEAHLLQSNMHKIKRGEIEVLVSDWENEGTLIKIELDPALDPKEIVLRLFKKSKKLKAGITHTEERIKALKKEIEEQRALLEQHEKITLQTELNKFTKECFSKKPPPKQEKLPFYEYQTPKGCLIRVGKNAKGNDLLTFRFANGNDWWLHVKDYPGSHVVLKALKGMEPDPESLQYAIQLAIFHSKAKDKGKVEVSITQKKYISRFGQMKKGMVQIAHHKTILSSFDKSKIEELKDIRLS